MLLPQASFKLHRLSDLCSYKQQIFFSSSESNPDYLGFSCQVSVISVLFVFFHGLDIFEDINQLFGRMFLSLGYLMFSHDQISVICLWQETKEVVSFLLEHIRRHRMSSCLFLCCKGDLDGSLHCLLQCGYVMLLKYGQVPLFLLYLILGTPSHLSYFQYIIHLKTIQKPEITR